MTSASVAWRQSGAIVQRDARLQYAYVLSFWLGWAGIVGQALTFYFISKLVGPSAAFGVNGRVVPYFDYVAVNLAFVRFQAAALGSFQRSVRGEQLMGTLEAILSTPTSLSLLVVSSGVWPALLTATQVALFLAVAWGLGLDLRHVELITLAVFLALTVLATTPIGILAAAAIMALKQEPPTGFLVGGIASLLGGVLFPIDKLPPALQKLSWCLPVTHSLAGIRAAFGGASLTATAGEALWLAVAAAVLLPLSLALFARAVRRAKHDGTLGEY